MTEAPNPLEQQEQSQPTFTPKKKITTIEDVFMVQDSLRTRIKNLMRFLEENLPDNSNKRSALKLADEVVGLATQSLMTEYQQQKGSN